MIEQLTGTEIFTGTASISTAIALVLKKFGYIHFGKKNGDGCPDSDCHNTVENTSEHLSELKTDFQKFKEDIYPKINQTSEDVSYIKGWIDGKKNGMG